MVRDEEFEIFRLHYIDIGMPEREPRSREICDDDATPKGTMVRRAIAPSLFTTPLQGRHTPETPNTQFIRTAAHNRAVRRPADCTTAKPNYLSRSPDSTEPTMEKSVMVITIQKSSKRHQREASCHGSFNRSHLQQTKNPVRERVA